MKLKALGLLLALSSSPLTAEEGEDSTPTKSEKAITGETLSGFVLPVLPLNGNAFIKSTRAYKWKKSDTQRLFMDDQVVITIADRRFTSDKAIIWINRIPVSKVYLNKYDLKNETPYITQISAWFPKFERSSSSAGSSSKGENLLLTASITGDIELSATILKHESPRNEDALDVAHLRLAAYLSELKRENKKIDLKNGLLLMHDPTPDEIAASKNNTIPFKKTNPPEKSHWLKDPKGTIDISSDRIELQPGSLENTVILDGNVKIEYHGSRTGNIKNLLLVSDRAVIFTSPGKTRELISNSIASNDIYGVYLEGGVVVDADNGQHLIRTPRAYYDFKKGEALTFNTLIRTKGKVPKIGGNLGGTSNQSITTTSLTRPQKFYQGTKYGLIWARAEKVRQVAKNQWQGQNAVISTSSFAKPHMSLGAKEIILETSDEDESILTASWANLKLGDIPIFAWPYYRGSPERPPINDLRIGFSDDTGNSFGIGIPIDRLTGGPLFGIFKKSQLDIDTYGDRGEGLKFTTNYNADNSSGNFSVEYLKDRGPERLATGKLKNVTDTDRGAIEWTHNQKLGNKWSLLTDVSLISDKNYISSWRRNDNLNRRPFTTRALLKRTHQGTLIQIQAQKKLNNFISNDWILASQGQQIEKIPELIFDSHGNILKNKFIWSTQNQIVQISTKTPNNTPDDLGFTNLQSQKAFGFNNTESFKSNITSDEVFRLVSKHKISFPFAYKSLRILPYASGAFLNNFDQGQLQKGNTSESLATFFSGGIQAHTQLHTQMNDFENKFLDLHRLRVIFEPSIHFWSAGSNFDTESSTIYQPEIDLLTDSTALKTGIRTRIQTYRGGPGRWYSLDWLTISAGIIEQINTNSRRFARPSFYDWRPELSSFSDFGYGSFALQLSDALAFTGEASWMRPSWELATGSASVRFRHSPRLSSSIEYRNLDQYADGTLLGGSVNYEISKRYDLSFRPTWDFDNDDFRAYLLTLKRKYPNFNLVMKINYDDIRSETFYNATLQLTKF